jgi:Zn ribbon nucleic-acid-binding protein
MLLKPLPVSKVMIVCPSCGKAARIKMKIEDCKKVRACIKCGKVIDTPKVKEEVKKKNNSKKEDKK